MIYLLSFSSASVLFTYAAEHRKFVLFIPLSITLFKYCPSLVILRILVHNFINSAASFWNSFKVIQSHFKILKQQTNTSKYFHNALLMVSSLDTYKI